VGVCRRTALALVLALLTSAALSSCGGGGKGTEASTAVAGAPSPGETTDAPARKTAGGVSATSKVSAEDASGAQRDAPRRPRGSSTKTTGAPVGSAVAQREGGKTGGGKSGGGGGHPRSLAGGGKRKGGRSHGSSHGAGVAGGGSTGGGSTGDGSSSGDSSGVGGEAGGDTFTVPTVNMEPTYPAGKTVKYDPANTTPARGQVVVFKLPSGALEGSCGVQPPPGQACQIVGPGYSESLAIGRVGALAGESIAFKEGNAIVNGQLQNEPWMKQCEDLATCTFPKPLTVPAGSYYIVYDNRGELDDSRVWGALPQTAIVGVVDGS
jgi:signal peptidase I